MTDHRPSPPEPEACLTCSRVSRYKGGTLIAEDVRDYATHKRRCADPDGYRPAWCPKCKGDALHVHDYPERHPLGGLDLPPAIRIIRYICAFSECRATWRILPAFLARHLWHCWRAVEQATLLPAPPEPAATPSAETVQRWRGRLASSARQLVLLLGACCGTLLEVIAKRTGLNATRFDLVGVHAEVAGTPVWWRLSDLAAIVHRLERGLRLM